MRKESREKVRGIRGLVEVGLVEKDSISPSAQSFASIKSKFGVYSLHNLPEVLEKKALIKG